MEGNNTSSSPLSSSSFTSTSNFVNLHPHSLSNPLFYHPFSFISFNINGLSSSSSKVKLGCITSITSKCKIPIIILQETHTDPSSWEFSILSTFFPHFRWFGSPPPSTGWGGLAIGIRHSFLSPQPIALFQTIDASSLGVFFTAKMGQEISIVSSYHSPRNNSFFSSLTETLAWCKGITVWGGDLNTTPESNLFTQVSSLLSQSDCSMLIPDKATHF